MSHDELARRILFEDNHLIVINKLPGELVQGDKTGDTPLVDELKEFLKRRDRKPGNVYLGVTHRLDRPTSGATLFAKTDKALSRMNRLFREGGVEKSYWAVVDRPPEPAEGRWEDWLVKDGRTNRSRRTNESAQGAKRAVMNYRLIASGDRFHLLEVVIETGRHHQIRCQLSARGIHIRGDLKYGAARSNPDGGISLHARYLGFAHPVGDEGRIVACTAPPPRDALWDYFVSVVEGIKKPPRDAEVESYGSDGD